MQPMAQFRASRWGGYLYIWSEGGNPVYDFMDGFWKLCAKRKEE